MLPLPSLIGEDGLDRLERYARKAPEGCFVEVGVYQGGSAQRLYKVAFERECDLHLFDTFEGMPFQGEHDRHKAGEFGQVDIEAFVNLAETAPADMLGNLIFTADLPANYAQRVKIIVI